MNINLSIDSLVIDETIIEPHKRYEFKSSVIIELQYLLSDQSSYLNNSELNNSAVLNGGEMMMSNTTSTTLKAKQVAKQIFNSMKPGL